MEDARDGRGSWRPSRPIPGTDGRALPVSQYMECARFLPVTAGDCEALQVTAGVCHLFYHIRRLQGPGVNPQDGRLYERWTRALPSLSTLPGMPATTARQGPVARPGRSGTLAQASNDMVRSEVRTGGHQLWCRLDTRKVCHPFDAMPSGGY
ncbi:hypothetical protein L873DRAFT_245965 [Choiromyces venosus 120613-1]|uniref:Uncharacterized protein n=1 Tax=Choiromyces venosus 120613-1 TaxID=1336337 RepID=A0A3N4J4L5_9PEZI|nr:hypothetical protein L873DRAFT_245965 [Choiromyces venosus 120613-1]